MRKIAEIIVSFMLKNKVISLEQDVIEFYTYGTEITVSSILNVVLVMAIGLIINKPMEALLFLCVFIFVRSFTGGFHADTYFRCNLLMCTSFSALACINHLISELIGFMLIGSILIFSIVIISVFCPIENVNKPIPIEKRSGLKLKGIIVCILLSIISALLSADYKKYSGIIMLTILWIAILVIAGKIKGRRIQS